MNGRACVCLSLLQKKLNNFQWNERILIKFSGPFPLCTSKFWSGVSDQLHIYIILFIFIFENGKKIIIAEINLLSTSSTNNRQIS
jgi:hypothetical protein